MLAIGDGAFGRLSGLDDIMRWNPQDEIDVLMKRDISFLSLRPPWKMDSHLAEAEPERELLPETDYDLGLDLDLALGLVASRIVRK